MGNSRSVPADSPLGKVLKRWARFSCSRMTKKRMVHYCNTAWPSYALETAGQWPVHGSMDRDTVLQLEQFCQHTGRKDELPYVRAFRALLERESGKGPKKTRDAALSRPNPSHLSSPQEEHPTMPSEPKPVVIPSVWEVGSPRHSSGCPPPAQEEHPTMPSEPKPVVIPSVWVVGSPRHSSGCSPPAQEEHPTMPSEPKPALILSVWEAGPCNQRSLYPRLPINSDLQYEPGPVTSSVSPYCQTLQGTHIGLGVSVSGAGQFLLRPYHPGNQWPSVEHMAHDLALLKNHRPSYKADPQGMTELFASIFTTYHPSWSYLQTLMDSLLTAVQVALIFGARILDYVFNLCEGNFDYLERLSDKLLLKIISYLDLEDIARLSQTSHRFAKLCGSDSLWEQIVLSNCDTITSDMRALAKDVGWRQMFFTNKIQLQRQIRRKKQAQGKRREKSF